jgi:hypothetical protein
MSRINDWLLSNDIRIKANPCVSPDFCLDWPALKAQFEAGAAARAWPSMTTYEASRFAIAAGQVVLMEDNATGDCAWFVTGGNKDLLADGVHLGGQRWAYPASFANLLTLKNLIYSYNPESTIFPTASEKLATYSIGVGARFTTLHWPGVDWAMSHLGLGLTANQNSIPRELVFDVNAMLDDNLATCPFPFIGGDVPEGHQGQSVEGMSHGCILTKLKFGFHNKGLAWGFNADHQPIGGWYDEREDQLVEGCLLASYITFDISPELTTGSTTPLADIPADLVAKVKARVADAGITLNEADFSALLESVYPSMLKMQVRDNKYAAIRAKHFSADVARAYHRELSIDELPGLTTPETLATMLALAEAMDMAVQYVAPAFGFQKNFPFEDQVELKRRVDAAWSVCDTFGVSIGFHSGSGKSAENYQLCGDITGSKLEIKTSGRYTYEMGHALASSPDAGDQALWQDWYAFTKELALNSAFADNETEQKMAREFIEHSLNFSGKSAADFSSKEVTKAQIDLLTPDPDHMLWFEYNFLYVLAANGSAAKDALGDHSPTGYRQRERFYAISDAGKLAFAKRIADYLIFLTQTTGGVSADTAAAAKARLAGITDYEALLADIAT